ncbi:MAG: ATPase domain-containing protein [Halobacteria archaeon]|nr:ATPase domain-containing protein [Halobacteria archaeon]
MKIPDQDERVPTGIEGFDEMSNGGFPKNAVNILTGRAGSGKTLFSTHFAVEGSQHDDTTVYISVDDTKNAVLRAARQYDLGLENAIETGDVVLHDYETLKERTGQSLVDFDDLTRMIDQLLNPHNADRLVLDSVAGLGLAEDSPNDVRRSILRFIRRVRENDVTSLFVTEQWEDKETRYGVEEYVGDSLVILGLEQMQNQLSRSISIRKMRFTDHDTSFRPIEITGDGMVVHKQGQVF